MENKTKESSASSSIGVRDILKQKILAQLSAIPIISDTRSIAAVVPVENIKPKLPALLPLNVPNNVSANQPKNTAPHKSPRVLPNQAVPDQKPVPCSDIQRQSDQKLPNIEEKVSKSPPKSDDSSGKLIMTGKPMKQPQKNPGEQSPENKDNLDVAITDPKSVPSFEMQLENDPKLPKSMDEVTKSPLKNDQPSEKCINKLILTDNSTKNNFNQRTTPPPPNKLGKAPIFIPFLHSQHQISKQPQKKTSEKLPENSEEVESLRLEIIKLNARHESYKLRAQNKLDAVLIQNDNLCSTIEKSEVEFQAIYDILTQLFTKERKISNDNEMLVLEKDAEVSKNENLLQDIDVLQRELEVIRKEKEEMKLLMNDKCSDFDEARKSYEDFENWLTNHFEELQVVANKKRDEISKLNRKCESLDHLLSVEISRHEVDTKELNNKVKTLEQNIQKLETEVKNEKQKNEKMQRDLSVLNEAKKDLQTLLKLDAQAAARDKQSYEERLEIVLNEKDNEIRKLEQKQQTELEKLASEMDRMRLALEKLTEKKENRNDDKNVKPKKVNHKSAKIVADSTSPAIKLRISLRNKRKICETVENKDEQVTHDEQNKDRSAPAPAKKSCGNISEAEEGCGPAKPVAVEVITLSDSED